MAPRDGVAHPERGLVVSSHGRVLKCGAMVVPQLRGDHLPVRFGQRVILLQDQLASVGVAKIVDEGIKTCGAGRLVR